MNATNYQEATMTTEEAESIVRRLAERSSRAEGPKVGELADALGVPPEEVARTLAEIRATAKPKRRSSRRERRVWLLSGLLALVIAGGAFAAAQPNVGLFIFGRPSSRRIYHRDIYEVFLDGIEVGEEAIHGTFDPDVLSQRIERILDEREMGSRQSGPTPSATEAARVLAAAQAGQWGQVPSLRFVRFEIRRPDALDHPMRWADTSMPVYTGDDAHVAELVRAERDRHVADAIKAALGDPALALPAAKDQATAIAP